jgi:hypothetical protein
MDVGARLISVEPGSLMSVFFRSSLDSRLDDALVIDSIEAAFSS